MNTIETQTKQIIVTVALSLLFFSSCSKSQLTTVAPEDLQLTPVSPPREISSSLVKPPGACDLPWGGFILSGEEVEAFGIDELSCQGDALVDRCSNHSQTRLCKGGVLSGSAEFEFGNCYEQGCPFCVFNVDDRSGPITVQHGDSLPFYELPSISCGQSCESVSTSLTCELGTMVGQAGVTIENFKNVSCKVDKCHCEAPDPNDPLSTIQYPHNTELEFWDSESIKCGSCSTHKVIRTCKNGEWSGSDQHGFRSCEELACDPCPKPWDPSQTVAHETTIDPIFLDQSPTCATGCKKTERMCLNGVLEAGPSASGEDKNSFVFESCDCQCEIPGTSVRMNKGDSFFRWTKSSSSLCTATSDDFKIQVSCSVGGVLTATKTNSGTPTDISGFASWVQSPTNIAPCKCTTPWNQIIDPGATGVIYSKTSGLCEDACAASKKDFVCAETSAGTYGLVEQGNPSVSINTSIYRFSSCSQPSCKCTTPWSDLLSHGDGDITPIFAYPDESPACGGNCDAGKVRVRCNGNLSLLETINPGDTFDPLIHKYKLCEVEKCDCTSPSPTDPAVMESHPHGTVKDFWDVEQITCGNCNAHKLSRTCNDGTWSGSANYEFRSCQPLPCQPCPLPYNPGTSVPHNTVEDPLFLEQSPACATGCKQTARTCNNGLFEVGPVGDGTDRSNYVFDSCNCQCRAPGLGFPIAKGSSIERWSKAKGICGESEADFKINVSCSVDGSSLTATFQKNGMSAILANFDSWSTSQTVIEPCKCSPPWGSVNEGSVGAAYSSNTGTCDDSCSTSGKLKYYSCERDGGGVLRVFEYGTTNLLDTSVYRYEGCDQPACTCLSPWNQIVQHGQQTDSFRTESPTCGVSCDLERMELLCDGNTGALSSVDPLNTFDPTIFKFGFCDVSSCAGAGSGSGGGEGDGIGRGSEEEKPDPPSRGGGGGGLPFGCSLVTKPITWDVYSKVVSRSRSFTTIETYKACQTPWENPPPEGIGEDFAMGGAFVWGTNLAAFKKQEIECDESCSEQRVVIRCDRGGNLIAPLVPLYPTCKKRAGCDP